MIWFLRVTALVMTIGLALPLLAEHVKKPDEAKKADDPKPDDKKKADDPKPDDKKKDDEKDKKEKLLPAGTLAGKITKFDADKRTMKVEVTFPVQKLNEGEAKAYMDAMNAYQTAANNRQLKPQDRFNAMSKAYSDAQTHYSKLYTVEKKTQEIELSILDDAKIRVANPPVAFDDDGKVKKYTKKELETLKGDPKLPGFPGEYDTLSTGALVQVTLVKKMEKPKPRPAPGTTPKPKDVIDDDALADHLPLVSMILIAQVADNK